MKFPTSVLEVIEASHHYLMLSMHYHKKVNWVTLIHMEPSIAEKSLQFVYV